MFLDLEFHVSPAGHKSGLVFLLTGVSRPNLMFNYKNHVCLLIAVYSRIRRTAVGIQAVLTPGLISELQQIRVP